jgi:biopolymer transport protein ExbD
MPIGNRGLTPWCRRRARSRARLTKHVRRMFFTHAKSWRGRRRARLDASLISSMNLVGLLSVLAALVLEFMLWNSVHRWNPRLPYAVHAVEQPAPEQGTLVTVRDDGMFYVDRVPLVRRELFAVLQGRFQAEMNVAPNADVLFLEVEPDVPFSDVQEVLELSRKAGALRAILLTERVERTVRRRGAGPRARRARRARLLLPPGPPRRESGPDRGPAVRVSAIQHRTDSGSVFARTSRPELRRGPWFSFSMVPGVTPRRLRVAKCCRQRTGRAAEARCWVAGRWT